MSLKTTAKAAVLILFFSLFSACGELSTSLFPSGGTYQVKALINDNPLESCSIIRQGDKIVPYFAVSVENDPDLIGLLVYLQNPKGDIIGERVLYTINPVNDAIQQETQQEDKASDDSGGKASEDAENNDSAASFGGTASVESNGETAGQTEDGLLKQVTEKKASVDTRSAAREYDTVIRIKSFGREMPSFLLPKNMETGPYNLVFKALGISNTLLSLTETDIFYLGNVEFRLNGISTYLPWLSDNRLIPPGTTVMLEANLDFDSSLNPYVIWYNGRNIIGEGNIKEGAGNILWKVPEQPGLYSLRLEVLPYLLKRNLTGIFREITLPVSAKASQTGYFFEIGSDHPAKRPLVAGNAYAEQVQSTAGLTANADKPVLPYPELIRWYRFDGNLNESSLIPERMFEPVGKKAPRWAAVGQSYGLSAGPDDIYLLRPIRFFSKEQNQGGGIFLFNIRPAAEVTVFSAFFPLLASASDGVWMDMSMRENTITLRLKTKSASVEIPVSPDYSVEQGFIPIVVEFYIRPNRFEAKLSLGEGSSMQSMAGGIRLPGALTGESRIRLGVDKTAPDNAVETKSALEPDLAGANTTPMTGNIPTETVKLTSAATTTVWDEFAVLYLTTLILPDEVSVEETVRREATHRRESRTSLPPSGSQAQSTDIQAGNNLIEQVSAKEKDDETPSFLSLP